MNVLQKLIKDLNENWPWFMAKEINLSYGFMYQIFTKWAPEKIREQTMDELYRYYRMEKDDFYIENQKKWQSPTQSILWSLFRKKRLEKFLSVDDVAKLVKWDSRAIHRIEWWHTLPNYNSYYITKFMEIYEFTEEEKQTISWFIVILRDVINIYKWWNDIENKVNNLSNEI